MLRPFFLAVNPEHVTLSAPWQNGVRTAHHLANATEPILLSCGLLEHIILSCELHPWLHVIQRVAHLYAIRYASLSRSLHLRKAFQENYLNWTTQLAMTSARKGLSYQNLWRAVAACFLVTETAPCLVTVHTPLTRQRTAKTMHLPRKVPPARIPCDSLVSEA